MPYQKMEGDEIGVSDGPLNALDTPTPSEIIKNNPPRNSAMTQEVWKTEKRLDGDHQGLYRGGRE